MIFQTHAPSKNLQPYVQCYMEADGGSNIEKGEYNLFPNGFSGIFFNFGNTGKIIVKEEYNTPPVSVFGQIDQHFTITHQPGFYSLGVLLKPTVLSRLLRVDMSIFTNKAFDGQLIQSDFKLLHRMLEDVDNVKKKIEILERYLSKALSSINHSLSAIDHALYLIEMQGAHSMKKQAWNLGISQRYLEINFKKTVGLPPKTYALIIRFKNMEQQIRNMSIIRWKDMEFASEYYDQNHFIKDFRRFTGLTPSGYLMENLEMGRSYLTV